MKKKVKSKVLTSKLGGLIIKVSSDPGVLEDDISLSVKELSKKDSEGYSKAIRGKTGVSLEKLRAFDITLVNAKGDEVQPSGKVKVSISGLGSIEEFSEVVAYHLEARDENLKIDEIKAEGKDEEIVFDTDHFSIYAIGTKSTATYNFYLGEIKVGTQAVFNDGKLEQPKTPAGQDGKKFIGWYLEGETDPINFNNLVSVSETVEYRVEARFADIYYVYFLYQGNIIKTKEIMPPNKFTNSNDVPLVILEEGKAFDHWSENIGGAAFNFSNEITKDTSLHAVLIDKWQVTFDSRGGNSLLPRYIENGENLGTTEDPLPLPVRTGYTFLRWNTKADGTGTTYTNTTKVNSSIKLYAIWQAKTNTKYSIIYWQQNADDDAYTYKETVTATGTTGSSIVLTGNNIKTDKYQYFTYKQYDTGKTIAGNEATIVNVYYSRNSYNLRFYNPSNTLRNTITAKYGQYIGNRFPIPEYQGRAWKSRTTSLYPDALQTLDRMPGQNVNFDLYNQSSTTLKTIKYYTENLTGDGYTLLKTVETYFNYITYEEEYHPIQGFDRQTRQTAGFTNNRKNFVNNNVDLNYPRLSYSLQFQNINTTAKTETVKYEAPLIDYYNYIPPRPQGILDGYTFKGWYTSPLGQEGTEAVTSLLKMPAGNAIVYAQWSPPIYSLKYYKTPNTSGSSGTVDNIPDGDDVSQAQLTGKILPDGLEESDFIGWYWYLDDSFVPYDFNTPVISDDYVLYPVWRESVYSLTYDGGSGSGIAPKDLNKYKLDSAANVLGAGNLIPPENKVFIGWENVADSQGKIYYPNDKLTITGNMVLTAKWADLVAETSLTYKANGGLGLDRLLILNDNSTHEVRTNPFTLNGYNFVGWNSKADGSGEMFQRGDKIVVSNSNSLPNELYAQWERMRFTIGLRKLDIGSESMIPGAKFLWTKEGETAPVELDLLDGYIDLDNLLAGSYTLKEIQAPRGYQLDNTEYTVVIGENGELSVNPNLTIETEEGKQILLVKNAQKAVFPNTGGPGSLIFTVLGISLMSISYILYRRRYI